MCHMKPLQRTVKWFRLNFHLLASVIDSFEPAKGFFVIGDTEALSQPPGKRLPAGVRRKLLYLHHGLHYRCEGLRVHVDKLLDGIVR